MGHDGIINTNAVLEDVIRCCAATLRRIQHRLRAPPSPRTARVAEEEQRLRAAPSPLTARDAEEKSLRRELGPRHRRRGAPKKTTANFGRMRNRLEKPLAFEMQGSEPCLLDGLDGEPGSASRRLPLLCRWAHSRLLLHGPPSATTRSVRVRRHRAERHLYQTNSS